MVSLNILGQIDILHAFKSRSFSMIDDNGSVTCTYMCIIELSALLTYILIY